ncbi:MAG: hypothetical protein DELT_00316 [Desulfovibrio sp.]
MKACILMASPRPRGNTAALLGPFSEELAFHGFAVEQFSLYDMDIHPCTACRMCQKDWSIFGCRFQDDAASIFASLLQSDLIVLATPIYSWYCTPPMKSLLDRLVYGMNKYYGEEKGPALWAGKRAAIITTCGYKPERGADLFEEGMKRYCKHSQLAYLGMLAERDLGYAHTFMDENKAERAREFARTLRSAYSQKPS